jgi:hypothetical protein
MPFEAVECPILSWPGTTDVGSRELSPSVFIEFDGENVPPINQFVTGHFRNRLIGGTDSIYKAFFSGLNFREYPQEIWPDIWY